ncbi:ABC transporter ATP-binding protein [Helicobacter labetoulli]|uniref:ABC transporter ATP-binding protein n=1 Tax=Helicobacter labetoulli TaxID=2315333 RepID=UPI000EF65426|nr:ATP-binding cassette domain-containing protein [Helicobacter labetoulli]
MLELENVSFYHRTYRLFSKSEKQILWHISLRIEKAKSYAIMGSSGCGKSTLAQVMCGILQPSIDELGQVGQVRFNGARLNLSSLAQRRSFYSQVQMLFQDSLSSLNPRFSCYENILEPLLYLGAGRTKEQIQIHIERLYQKLSLPKEILDKSVAMISGGEAQRICLIRALLLEPRILILDESLSGLDYELCDEVLEFLREWQEQSGAGVVLITHDESVALRFCEKVYVLEQGKLI